MPSTRAKRAKNKLLPKNKAQLLKLAKGRVKSYYTRNPEVKKAISRVNYSTNPEKKRATTRANYSTNPEKKRAAARASYSINLEKKRAACYMLGTFKLEGNL